MITQGIGNCWIENCVVQRITLHGGLVLNLDDHNELVIAQPLTLLLPATPQYPAEEVRIDPDRVTDTERSLLDFAGATCTSALVGDDGTLRVEFSTGHRIEVGPDAHRAAWELYGKRHGFMACLPGGEVHVVRYDTRDTRDGAVADA